MQIKTIVKNWCPPALFKILESLLPHIPYYRKSIAGSAHPGRYANWEEALRDSDGYDAWKECYCIGAEAEELDRLVVNETEVLNRKKIFYSRQGQNGR